MQVVNDLLLHGVRRAHASNAHSPVNHNFTPGVENSMLVVFGCGEWTAMWQTVMMAVLPTLMIVAAASDVTSFRIPNWLTALTAAMFFPMALLSGMPLQEFGYHLLAGVILFIAGYLLFAVGVFGGGDSKLLAATGLWFGTQQTLPFLFMTVMAGGLLTLAVVAWTALSMWGEVEDVRIANKFNKLKPKIPYGFALAAGAILAFPDSWWMRGVA